LAEAAGVSLRATFRYVKAAGFRSARRLVATARALHAYRLLMDHGRSGSEVAKRLGYRGVDQLSEQLTELANCTVSDIRRGASPPDFERVLLCGLVSSVPSGAGVADYAE